MKSFSTYFSAESLGFTRFDVIIAEMLNISGSYRKLFFHVGRLSYHVGRLFFHVKRLSYHVGRLFFHVGRPSYHVGRLFFHVGRPSYYLNYLNELKIK
jgi:hypothetical protein